MMRSSRMLTIHIKSLRTQIREGREELVRLEQAGQDTTQKYIELEKHVASLTDAFGDQQERIRVLASDTRLLDFGKAAITSATAAFSAYTSIAVLAGNESEELQKKTMQLFAAMQLLTSLEQVANQVKRGGVLITNAQSAAQSVYTAVVGASTGALRAFRIALLGTGIGAAVIGIGLLVKKFIEFRNAQNEAGKEQKILSEIQTEAIQGYAAEVTKLDLIRQKLTNLNEPQKERIKLAKEYNKIAAESNKIDLQQIDNIDALNAAIDRQIQFIEKRALATAAKNVVAKKAEDFFNAQQTARTKAEGEITNEKQFSQEQGSITPTLPAGTGIGKPLEVGQVIPVFNAKTKRFENRALTQADIDALKQDGQKFHQQRLKQQEQERINRSVENDKSVQDAKEELDRAIRLATGFIDIDSFIKTPQPKTTNKKEIENVFEQEKDKLIAQLSELRRTEADSVQKINDEFVAKLEVEKNRIEKLIADKKVTAEQGEVLFRLAIEVNKEELDKALIDFNKKVTDARKKLNDELNDLQQKANEDSINLLQDEFDRRARLIEFNEQKELQDQNKIIDERLKALDTDRLLLGEEAYQRAKQQIITTGEIEANNIIKRYALERQDLSADIFEKSLQRFQDSIFSTNAKLNEQVALAIRTASNRFLSGNINFSEFQKQVDDIKENAESESRNTNLQNNQAELFAIDHKLASMRDHTSKAYQDLFAKRKKLSDDTSKLEAADAEADAKKVHDKAQERIDTINSYVTAVGDLAQSVISFWQSANEAEQKALEKSIQLQEERVNAAIRIAERGNASYLRQEEDRLKELQVARENAARRQLAIDAALQASQVLVAITGAVAKIAALPPGANVAEVIAEIAVIVSALATGYGIVRSLQNNQPQLKTGTTYLERNGHPQGVDTIPAWLTEGEAVIPRDRNKSYKKSVEAIYHGKVPAEVMNDFVEDYVRKDKKQTKPLDEKEKRTLVNEIKNVTSDENLTKDIKISEIKKIIDSQSKIGTDENIAISKYFSDIINSEKNLITTTQLNKILKTENLNRSENKNIAQQIKKYEDLKQLETVLSTKLSSESVEKIIKQIQETRSKHVKNVVENISVDTIDKFLPKKEDIFKTFVANTSHVPTNVIENFINNYQKTITEKRFRDVFQNTSVKDMLTVKHVPQPHYDRIKQATEVHISHNAKLATALSEQNNLLKENNELQKETLRALRAKNIAVNIDKEGVAVTVIEAMERQKINMKL
jgi:hypothetical protein